MLKRLNERQCWSRTDFSSVLYFFLNILDLKFDVALLILDKIWPLYIMFRYLTNDLAKYPLQCLGRIKHRSKDKG